MKKFLAIVLALICVFSMATVAFAATTFPANTCEYCGATFTSDAEFRAHVETVCDRVCSYCGGVLSTNEAKVEHEYNCLKNVIKCDYCGDEKASQKAFDEHIDACKAEHYNIPVSKILTAVKDLFAKIDWSALFAKVTEAVKGLVGNISAAA